MILPDIKFKKVCKREEHMEVEEATERNEAGESEEREESDANEQETDVSLVPKSRTNVSATHGNTSNLFTHLLRKHQSCIHKLVIKGVARGLGAFERVDQEHVFTQSQKYNTV